MNILQLLPELNQGGVERCTLETAHALILAGHQSTVISHGGRLVKQLESEGSTHVCLPIHQKSLASLWQIKPLRKLILEIKPDIIHVRSRMPAWILKFALKGVYPRPKIISTVHGFNSVNRYSQIMTQADLVIAGSQSVVDFIHTHYPTCPKNNIKLIYEGINPQDFPYGLTPSSQWLAHVQQKFPELTNKIWITLPGRITRLKGHEAFIDLIHNLKDKFPIHGVIIGEAHAKKRAYFDALNHKINALNLQNHISFVGHQADMPYWLAASNIVLSLSTQAETFGRTVLEAISLGKPVFAWQRGGVAEILAQTFPVGLVKPDDFKAMQSAIEHQLTTPQYPLPLQHFLLQDMTDKTISTYQSLLESYNA